MADWDDDDYEPKSFEPSKPTDKWAGEDEDDDDVKDNWDDDDEEETDKREVKKETSASAAPTKKKRTLKQVLKEKEEQKLKEEELRREIEEAKPPTEEDLLAEKLRKQKLVEEADLQVTKDTFGISGKSIDSLQPANKSDFAELSRLLVEKLSSYEGSAEYIPFLEVLFRDLCAGLEAEDIKKLGSTLSILSSEKIKAQKGPQKKKKTKKATLTGASAKAGMRQDMDAFGEYGNYDDNDMDDFM